MSYVSETTEGNEIQRPGGDTVLSSFIPEGNKGSLGRGAGTFVGLVKFQALLSMR